MIRIISGWTNHGGSTEAFIKLTNELNAAGHETIFSGPHSYHLGKCRAEQTNKIQMNKDDTLIVHFLDKIKERPPVKKVILVSHEKWWFEISKLKQFWDEVVFLHEDHRFYHKDYLGKYSLIPNFKDTFTISNKDHLDKIAGVIGTIEQRKQTHLSIERALKDGCEKVYLFGKIGDPTYYNTFIHPILSDKVINYGFADDKQKMYDMIGRVYHSSIGEVASIVKDECHNSSTKFFGCEETTPVVSDLTREEILDRWKNVLEINNTISTFIVCHDQDIILKDSPKFNHINYKWIFVGKKDCSKIKHLSNVIVARDLKHNIEQYKNLCSYTAWYAIVKNQLCSTKNIAVLEYDCDISKNFESECLSIMSKMKNKGVIGFLNSLLVHPIYLKATPYFPANVEKMYGIKVEEIINHYASTNFDNNWNSGSNAVMSLEYLNGFVDWSYPILTMNVEDPLIAHVHERLIKLYSILFKVDTVVDPTLLRHYQHISHGIVAKWTP